MLDNHVQNLKRFRVIEVFAVIIIALSCKSESNDSSKIKYTEKINFETEVEKFDLNQLVDKEAGWELKPESDLLSNKPIVIVVHGYNPELNGFRPLIDELISSNFQVFSYNYDWKGGMEVSANHFVLAVRRLLGQIKALHLYVIAHSNGGLITRRSMVVGRKPSLADDKIRINLTTIATPFGGYFASNLLKFGLPYFDGIPDSLRDIGSITDFIKKPGILGPKTRHFKIETLEGGKKRYFSGEIISDENASLKNQANQVVDTNPNTIVVSVVSGHSGILRNSLAKLDVSLLKYVRELAKTAFCVPACRALIPAEFTRKND